MSLKERREIVDLHTAANADGGILFSVVGVLGLPVSDPGARLLLVADGRTAGTLPGGCAEAVVLRRDAWRDPPRAVVERFGAAYGETAELLRNPDRTGGEVELLLEPTGTPEADALVQALDATLSGSPRSIATTLPGTVTSNKLQTDSRTNYQTGSQATSRTDSQAGSPADSQPAPLMRFILDEQGDVLFASEDLPTEDIVDLRRVARSAAHNSLHRVGRYRLFVEHLGPS